MSTLTFPRRGRTRRWCTALILAAVPTALITASVAPADAATPGIPAASASSCAWPSIDSPEAGNVFAPDSSATYWIQPFTVSSDLQIAVSGTFPDARYASFTVYGAEGGDFTANSVHSWLTDYQIAPDPGSVNPWQQPARPGGKYTLTLTADAAPGQANTLPLAPTGTADGTTGYLVYRVYLPENNDFGSVPLPTLTFEEPGTSTRLQPCTDPSPATDPDTSGGTTTGTPLEFARNAPGADSVGFPNADSGYLKALVPPPGPGQVVVVSGKAPVYSPGNLPTPWPNPVTQVRYWSMCVYLDQPARPLVVNQLPDGTTDFGCRADEATALSPDGYYTYVVGTEAQRAEIEAVPGVTFLPLSTADPTTTQVLLLRNMLANSSFAQAIQNVPQDGSPLSAQEVMGPYYPQAAACSLSTLVTHGPQACLSGS